jgi:hypothetical protein
MSLLASRMFRPRSACSPQQVVATAARRSCIARRLSRTCRSAVTQLLAERDRLGGWLSRRGGRSLRPVMERLHAVGCSQLFRDVLYARRRGAGASLQRTRVRAQIAPPRPHRPRTRGRRPHENVRRQIGHSMVARPDLRRRGRANVTCECVTGFISTRYEQSSGRREDGRRCSTRRQLGVTSASAVERSFLPPSPAHCRPASCHRQRNDQRGRPLRRCRRRRTVAQDLVAAHRRELANGGGARDCRRPDHAVRERAARRS